MAEPLKNHYGAEMPRAIARMIEAVHAPFDSRAFLHDALDGYDALELMQRGRKIADALHAHLPASYPQAMEILLASIDQPAGLPGKNPMASFLFLPHTLYVAKYGLEHFDVSMRAQHALTQRFTAEISIRPFIELKQILTLRTLKRWTRDPSEHVRRLVSEGTRPRLPWAPRLRAFQRDPRPALALLELLKDDPSLYVRRSVANNLNDIGKDHPELLFATAARWMKGADANRQWIIRHALRSAVKRGEAGALRVLGFGKAANVAVTYASVSPARVKPGAGVVIAFDIVSTAAGAQALLADLRVHYVKANGKTSGKVFKLREMTLPAKGAASFSKRLSLKDLTTRKHYPGVHRVEAVINGHAAALGEFVLPADQ
jgi:3-methyladenine DNA glycosylase AlkC